MRTGRPKQPLILQPATVVVDETQLSEPVHEKGNARERVVPTISAIPRSQGL
jgi:hypothetical protein